MAIDLSQDPYYDDFDPTKNFHKILYRPGFPVQARELTQSQSILQDQVSKFGDSIYRNGSIVTGGQTMLEVTATKYVCIEAVDPTGAVVDVNNFIGKFVVDGESRGIRAYVIAGAAATTTSPTYLIVKYTSGQIFDTTLTQPIVTEDGLHSVAIIASLTTPTNFTDVTSGLKFGDASICSINEGVFYVNGYFVQVSPQTVVLDAFDKTPTYRIGLQIEESLVDATQDASLLDPAQGATNYQAPGADRYKISLTLTKRSFTSQDDTKFIELLRVTNGLLTKKIIYPIYSNLEETLARRTNDQSGSFTVRPFKVATVPHDTYANAYNIIVEPGKAYVQGYEFETIGPTVIKAERARSVANVTNYNTTIDYQNWLEVTKLVGPIPFKTLQAGALHCVPTASIATANAAVAANTLIGTIRIRALEFSDANGSTSIANSNWIAYCFDSNVAQSIVANVAATGNSTTMRLAPNFSSVANAYAGVKFTVTKHNGVTVNESHTIGVYDGPNNVIALQGTETFAFGTPNTATQYRLDYEFKDVDSIVYANTTVNQHLFSTTMDVSTTSKNAFLVDQYQGAFLSDTGFNKLILALPYPMIASQSVVGGIPITNTEYFGRKAYTGQSFTANVCTITSAAGITSAVNGTLSGSIAQDNILVVVKNNTGSPIANNQVIDFSSNQSQNTVSVTTVSNTSTWVITVPNMNSASAADVYVKVKLPYSHSIGSLLKSKTARIANTASGLNSGGIQIPDSTGLVQWYSQGAGTLGAQITIYANSAAWLNLKDPTKSQSIFTSDVTTLRKVIDVGTNLIEDGNVAIAQDITTHYTLDNGQRDNSYEHASISLKPGTSGPTGNVVIYVDYLAHSGLGYLTVDSYASANIAYANIPSYTSSVTGEVYNLRDSIDFRPRRQDGDFLGIYDETILGTSGLTFETDFSYYLSRVDKIVLTKDRNFEVLSGVSSLDPVAPADKDNAMTLYDLYLTAYTADPKLIRQTFHDNRRYTMRDIGTLEKRISNLEYYTSLNLLEQAAKSQEIVDDIGANRFKNGILVDPFTGHKIGDVMNPDYICSIDQEEQELRPPFHLEHLALELNATNSTNYARKGAFVTLPFTVQTLIDQSVASRAVNVNPFNVISFIGQIKLDPASDNWVDRNQAPDVNVNLEGDADAWSALAFTVNKQTANAKFGTTTFGTVWNDWQTNFYGVKQSTSKVGGAVRTHGKHAAITQDILSRKTTTITQGFTRTGITSQFGVDVIHQSIGSKVKNVSIVPYIRSRGVLFIGKSFAANTNLYAFFDSTAVTNYCNRLNVVKVAGAQSYKDDYQDAEQVRVYDPARGANSAFAYVVLSRKENGGSYTNVSVVNVTGGDDGNVANAYFMHTSNSTFLVGMTSGANARISGYYHNSGFVTNPNVSSILLSHDVANSNVAFSNTFLAGKTIYFTSGSGLGQSSVITSYNANTRNLAFGTLGTALGSNTTYSIGQFQTDWRGEVPGIFVIPSNDSLRFRTGERQFTLADSITGLLDNSVTNGSVKYDTSGLVETMENTVISTRVPVVQQSVVTDNKTVTTTKVTDTKIGEKMVGWWDPLAQTILIDQKNHPSGVQVTGIRLLVRSADPIVPLQVQLRPVVNGFPHSSSVIPGSDITINPENVVVCSEEALSAKNALGENPLDDATLYTQVNFSGPVFLQQGMEYAIVLMANSIKYRVYVSRMGETLLGTNRIISEQPYLGVLFKSQNSSTWTPVQEEDLTFRMLYANYDTTVSANVEFKLSASNGITNNIAMDTYYVSSKNLVLPNTSIAAMAATRTATGVREENVTIPLDENIYFDDTLGRRVASSDTSSFKLRLLLSSQNQDVSPVVDLDSISLLAIQNLVNNLGLDNTSITVVSSSNNWYTAANLSVTISGGGGSGANAYIANTQIDSNNHVLANVVVDVPGSGYTTAPNVTISGNNTISANLVCVGEDHSSGGPAYARYITRKVTLTDGMDAGDFRVYFNAYKPSTSNIYVYYKILSADDTDIFDNKGYKLMTIIQGYNNVSLNQNDIKDFVAAPGSSNIADDRVQYGSFTSFKYFAIKVVMTATDTTKVPRISNFRVVALPALS